LVTLLQLASLFLLPFSGKPEYNVHLPSALFLVRLKNS
jgi:hypothetical protein